MLHHGLLGQLHEWQSPQLVTEYDVSARLTFTDIKAHEYVDNDRVLHEKVKLLAGLIRKSKHMIAFTGAGISTAAGIDDYATRAKGASITAERRPNIRNWRDAMPTKSHYVLTALHEFGFLKHWIQQNHDSLPQKAGYPQYALNEIHGSLHDPSNPIVPYEGQLRPDLFAWMTHWETKSDLCLAMGTSLSGFTADNVPIHIARRRIDENKGLGLVIINLQCTPYDELSTLRIYGCLDRVLELLAEELLLDLAVAPMNTICPHQPLQENVLEEDVFRIPFDSHGFFSEEESQVLDLRVGSWIQLTAGPYADDIGQCTGKTSDGHYRIHFTESVHPVFNILRRPFTLTLGFWWIDLLTRGISYGTILQQGSQKRTSPVPVMNVRRETRAQDSATKDRRAGAARLRVDRYVKMMKYGIGEEGITQMMRNDGVGEEEVRALYETISCAEPGDGNQTVRSPNTVRRALDAIESFISRGSDKSRGRSRG
jgi:NAD-dependent SIR2 family protein deacetylase